MVGNCASILPPRAGAWAAPFPGHEVAVVDGAGRAGAAGERGVIAVRRTRPGDVPRLLEQPDGHRGEVRRRLAADRRHRAGSTQTATSTYLGREDDLINSAGYRIGPAEIEDCLSRHPAVALCAVIGVPDELRGERIKAFVVPPGGAGGATP